MLTVGLLLLVSAFFMIPIRAENWSTPTKLTAHLSNLVGHQSMSADGSKIAFSAYVGDYPEIFVVNSDGTELKQLTSNSRTNTNPSISADGSKIAFLSYRRIQLGGSGEPVSTDFQVFVVNSDGTELKQLTDQTFSTGNPSISSDGNKITLCSLDNIYIVNFDGTGLKQLTNSSDNKNPAISGDGSKIAFLSKVREFEPYHGDYELFVMNSDGTAPTQLTFNSTISSFNTYPSISSNGSRISFANNYGDVFVVNSDGTGLKEVASNTAGFQNGVFPSITGDGRTIAFATNAIFVIQIDGTEVTNLGTWQEASAPSISAEGSTIAFTVRSEGVFVSLNLDLYEDLNAPVSTANYDGQWHISDFNVNITATDDLLVAETYYKLNGGTRKNVASDGQPLITTESTNNTLEYWSVDIAGKNEQHKTLTGIKLDKTAPTGSIKIDGNATSTFSTSVTLSLSASDLSGVSEMRFSNNGTDWTSWETYEETKSWTLPLDAGNKTVYVQFKDSVGWVSEVYADTITLTVVEPTPQPEPFPTTVVAAAIATTAAIICVGLVVYFKKLKH